MMNTTELKSATDVSNSMDEQWIWYLAGFIDSTANLRITVAKDERLTLGYSVSPQVRVSRPTKAQHVYGMVDEFAENEGVYVRYYEDDNSNSVRMEIDGVTDIQNFIEPLLPGFVQQYERAEFFLDEVLELFEDGPPQSKEEFIEMMEVDSELRKFPINRGESKYTEGYFRREWDMI